MKNFFFIATTTVAFVFGALWRHEATINKELKHNLMAKEFAHMDFRGDMLDAMKEETPEKIKDAISDGLARDVGEFFKHKHAGDDWRL